MLSLPLKALKTEMVQYLVKLLETRMEQQENPSAVKAQIVNALKAMLRSLKYGDQVHSYLYLLFSVQM